MGSALFDFILPFVIILGILVFFHELGHYLAAKLFGMKVDAFSLGFPPRAWGFRWGTGRLKKKFQRDILISFSSNPEFQPIHAQLNNRGLSQNEEQSVRLLGDWFGVDVQEIKSTVTNKKGKPVEKTDIRKTLTIINPDENTNAELKKEIFNIIAGSPELTDSVLQYKRIHDEESYVEHFTTDYCLSWVPLGGYCKINGMIDESFDPESMKEGRPHPWEYRSKPVWQRIFVISGGVLFNFFLGALIFAFFAIKNGVPDVDQYNQFKLSTQISEVLPDSPAMKAGLQSGDRITAVNGQKVESWQELVAIIHTKAEVPVTVEWLRDGNIMSAEITPKKGKSQTAEGIREVGLIGIAPMPIPEFTKPVSFFEGIAHGVERTAGLTGLILSNVKQIITGEQSFRESMGGPIAIVRMTGEVKQKQGWEGIWYFMALLSVMLAVFNLFPIPALDGGHLVFLLIEGIIRKPLSIKFKLYAQQTGMALLLVFIVYVVINDILRWTGSM